MTEPHRRLRHVIARRLFDLFVLSMAGGAIVFYFAPLRLSRAPVTFYVSPRGSDWAGGRTADDALRTIQQAAERVLPGDTIRLLPGTYRERIHVRRGGRPGAPVTIEAAIPGRVLLTWETALGKVINSDWRAEGDGIFSCSISRPVYVLRDGNEHLFCLKWGGFKQLKTFVRREWAWGAFCVDNGRLHVFLRGKRHPESIRLSTHLPVPEPREWGEFKSANLWIEADHVVVRGLCFDFGIGANVNIWSGQSIDIEDCSFTGATFGILAGRGTKPSPHLRVSQCLYQNYPQGEWARQWLPWDDIYAHYSSQSLLCSRDADVRVERNLVAHCGDGLRLTVTQPIQNQGAEITGNWISGTTDDAIEFDGPGREIHVRHNLFLDCFLVLGLSPVSTGPVRIKENLALPGPSGRNVGLIKFLSPWKDEAGRPIGIKHVSLEKNLLAGQWLCWWSPDVPVEESRFIKNVFVVRHVKEPPWPPSINGESNQLVIVPEKDLGSCPPWILLSTNQPAVQNLLSTLVPRLTAHPGPSWYQLNEHPATAPLDRLATWLRQRQPG